MKANDILWEPDRTEVLLANARARQKLFAQELRERELLEQREWLSAATRRMAEVALELDAAERRIKLQEEIEKNDKWWADLHEREKEANAKLMAQLQDQLDGGVHAAMLARANKAKAEMDRDNARLERLALLKRGVLRGTRKQSAAGRLAY
jgi:hypothetical protein